MSNFNLLRTGPPAHSLLNENPVLVRPSPTTSGKVRGFTLIELMVVVVIIAVMAVIAVPLFSARMQGRRILQVAGRVADLYRGSRTRALARGAAVVVTLDKTTNAFQVLEGVEGTTAANASGAAHANCGNLPTRGCLTNAWGDVSTSTSTIGAARVIEGIGNQAVTASMTVGTSTPGGPVVAVCFSPAGRTYLNRTGTWTADSWEILNNIVTLDIGATSSTTSPRHYQVIVMPNGTARLAP